MICNIPFLPQDGSLALVFTGNALMDRQMKCTSGSSWTFKPNSTFKQQRLLHRNPDRPKLYSKSIFFL